MPHRNLHLLLISLVEKLGYIPDAKGVCFGAAHMGIQAIFANDLSTFDLRLRLIAAMFPDGFEKLTPKSEEYKKILDRIQARIEKAKANIIASQKKANAPHGEQEVKHNYALGAHPSLVKIAEKIQQEDSLEKIEKTLTPDEMLILDQLIADFNIFVEGVALYQDPPRHQELFFSNVYGQNAKNVLPLLSPVKIDPIVQMTNAHFSGLYQQNELLESYFQPLREAWEKFPDVKAAFHLGNSVHGISISYDTKKKCWILINANSLPSKEFKEDKDMVDSIRKAFSENEIVIFTTLPYAQATQVEKMNEILKIWKQSPAWQQAHQVTKEKAALRDSHHGYWLMEGDDPNVVKELLKNGANVLTSNILDYTPVTCALPFSEARKILWKELCAKVKEIKCEKDTPRYTVISSVQARFAEAEQFKILEEEMDESPSLPEVREMVASSKKSLDIMIQLKNDIVASGQLQSELEKLNNMIEKEQKYFQALNKNLDLRINLSALRVLGLAAQTRLSVLIAKFVEFDDICQQIIAICRDKYPEHAAPIIKKIEAIYKSFNNYSDDEITSGILIKPLVDVFHDLFLISGKVNDVEALFFKNPLGNKLAGACLKKLSAIDIDLLKVKSENQALLQVMILLQENFKSLPSKPYSPAFLKKKTPSREEKLLEDIAQIQQWLGENKEEGIGKASFATKVFFDLLTNYHNSLGNNKKDNPIRIKLNEFFLQQFNFSLTDMLQDPGLSFKKFRLALQSYSSKQLNPEAVEKNNPKILGILSSILLVIPENLLCFFQKIYQGSIYKLAEKNG